MSLSREEVRRTRDELQRNHELSGLSEAEIAADLGLTETQVRDALTVSEAGDPAAVWLVRDYVEQAVRDQGAEPVAFTVLTEASRARARTWFSLRSAPHHAFAGGRA